MKFSALIFIISVNILGACGSQLEDSTYNENSQIDVKSSFKDLGLNEGFLNRNTYTEPYVAVNNRGDSTISLIDDDSKEVMRTITAQDVGFEFEPAYVVALHRFNLIVVGDRLNNKILAFNAKHFEFIGSINVAAGPFHMWPSPRGNELFIASNVSNQVQVIKFQSRGNRIQFETSEINFPEYPESVIHDVVADQAFIYATLQNPTLNKDFVVRVSRTENRYSRNRKTLEFSFDSHLAIARTGKILYVAESQTGKLTAVSLRNFKFEVKSSLSGLSGAHGVWANDSGNKIFVTNINSDGSDAIYEVKRELGRFNLSLIQTLDLDYSKPHNITCEGTENGGNLYVTHSGSNNRHVSVLRNPRYDSRTRISGFAPAVYRPAYVIGTVETGTNPFGLYYIH